MSNNAVLVWCCLLFSLSFINLLLLLFSYWYARDKFLLACLQEYKVVLWGFYNQNQNASCGCCRLLLPDFSIRPHWILPVFRLLGPCNLNSFLWCSTWSSWIRVISSCNHLNVSLSLADWSHLSCNLPETWDIDHIIFSGLTFLAISIQ